jgi:CheY-like chemotaxis protein
MPRNHVESAVASAVGQRVLVVEDECLTCLDLQQLLNFAHLEVAGPATSVGEALELLDEGAIDVALIDIHLSHTQTTALVAERLRSRRIPYALITGYDEQVLPRHLADAPVIRKPYLGWEVLRTVHRLLASDRREDRHARA